MIGDDRRPPPIAAILLGAQSWPHWEALDSVAFKQSHDRFDAYLRGTLGVPDQYILDLFDSDLPPSDIVARIQAFLAPGRWPDSKPTELLVYYVGHGDTVAGEYRLFIAQSKPAQPNSSSLSASSLSEATREGGRSLRTYFILDACFSAAATDAFKAPTGSIGVAFLTSASRDERSRTPADSSATPFTDALVTVLTRGDPGMSALLSLREICHLVEDEITAKNNGELTRPEIHSPLQGRGDIADLSLLPNPDHRYSSATGRGAGPAATRADTAAGIEWCAIASQADQETRHFQDAIEGFADSCRGEIERETGWLLAQNADILDSRSVLASARDFQLAVDRVCRAPLAFFDLTGFEPGVMLLLGIRSVIRRGVTICSVAGPDTSFEKLRLPFLIREINITGHSPAHVQGRPPEVILGEKVRAGISQLIGAPHFYADLPTFDPIRRLSPDPNREWSLGAPSIPYHERVLVLCSYSDDYLKENWSKMADRLASALKRQIHEDPVVASGAQSRVKLERSVDISSPQLVSTSLFEAIRLTDFCLCDLTDWSPNVLFELGVRLASNELDPVCILAAGDRPEDDARCYGGAQRMRMIQEQCGSLGQIIPILRYSPRNRPDYHQMVRRHLELREASGGQMRTWVGGGHLPVGSTYRLVWRHALAEHEPGGATVVDSLRVSAGQLSIKTGQGSNRFIFPATHPLTQSSQRNETETLAAAWLYLRHRVGMESLCSDEGEELSEEFLEICDDLLGLLTESDEERDRMLATEVSRDRKMVKNARRSG
jgi:hypothetical protein